MTKSEAERELIEDLQIDRGSGRFGVASNMIRKEFEEKGGNLPESKERWWATDVQDYESMRRDQTYWPKRAAELEEFDDWNSELEKRNKERNRNQ
jgi:hypothetical protein